MIKSDQLFGKLVTITPTDGQHWLCYCVCGNEVVCDTEALLSGTKTECGDCFTPICPEQIDHNAYLYQGREYTSAELVALTGLSWQLLRYRMIDRGMTLTQAIAYQSPTRQAVTYQGVNYSYSGLAAKLGINRNTVQKRRSSGFTIDQVYGLPPGSVQEHGV